MARPSKQYLGLGGKNAVIQQAWLSGLGGRHAMTQQAWPWLLSGKWCLDPAGIALAAGWQKTVTQQAVPVWLGGKSHDPAGGALGASGGMGSGSAGYALLLGGKIARSGWPGLGAGLQE
jgi:hypothetical protein